MTANPPNIADMIAESLQPERQDKVRDLFNAEGLRAPEVIWSPGEAELSNPLHRQFARICQSRMKDGVLPATAIRPDAFGELTDRMMVLEVENGGEFRYSHYGSLISEYSGLDLTNQLTTEFRSGFEYLSVFFTGLYKAVVASGQWVYSMHEPPEGIFVKSWQRLIVPLVDGAGEVTRLFVLNVPENELRVGLELMVDPVFVVGTDRKVLFANRSAHRMFSLPARPDETATFSSMTGIELSLRESPEDLLSSRKVIDSVELTNVGMVMERLVMTVSAAQHRSQAFYVVVMRALGT